MSQVTIGRQPIFDRDLNVIAYELLWRANNKSESANVIDGDQATTDVILNALVEIGLDRITGNFPAFINLTRNFLLGHYPLPEMSNRLVLEILEDIEITDEVLHGIKTLAQQGYPIALDDFIFHPGLEPLVELADIVKIDIMALSEEQLRSHVERLKKYPVKLLAEKIETQQEFELMLQLGFDYFQGFFLTRPNIVQGKKIPVNKMAVIQLLAGLANPDITTQEIEQLIQNDVTLSYRILRYINSAQYNIQREIESISHATMMLGQDTLLQLANLLMLSRIDNKPQELIMTALINAKMSEQLALQKKCSDSASYFTAGLFSIIDALMDQPMEEVLLQIPLSDKLQSALLQQEGEIGAVLKCVLAYERADWDHVKLTGVSRKTICECYLSAIDWAGEISALMH